LMTSYVKKYLGYFVLKKKKIKYKRNNKDSLIFWKN
jgi:hypothetical protein